MSMQRPDGLLMWDGSRGRLRVQSPPCAPRIHLFVTYTPPSLSRECCGIVILGRGGRVIYSQRRMCTVFFRPSSFLIRVCQSLTMTGYEGDKAAYCFFIYHLKKIIHDSFFLIQCLCVVAFQSILVVLIMNIVMPAWYQNGTENRRPFPAPGTSGRRNAY